MLRQDLARALEWYAGAVAPSSHPTLCGSRDIFQARLDSLLRQLLRSGWVTDEAALVVAVLGELGNNSFDHNLGQWEDVPGCVLGHVSGPEHLFWVADRGVGIHATLRRVDPSIATAQQAIEVAFARVLSGRAPERRGNGLKFVRAVINGHESRGLVCKSGAGVAEFGAESAHLNEVKERLQSVTRPGVVAVLAWRAQA